MSRGGVGTDFDLHPRRSRFLRFGQKAGIHGARGIIYFVHQFAPSFVEAGVLQDAEMTTAIGRLNRSIQDLAPVINSPEPAVHATLDALPGGGPKIAVLTRRQDDATFVFAVGMSEVTTQATFNLPVAGGSVEVVDEGRTVPATAGSWTDEFQGYQVHIYRVQSTP